MAHRSIPWHWIVFIGLVLAITCPGWADRKVTSLSEIIQALYSPDAKESGMAAVKLLNWAGTGHPGVPEEIVRVAIHVAHDLHLKDSMAGLVKVLGQSHAHFLPLTRSHAALALGVLPQLEESEDTIEPLATALHDPEYLVRASSAQALGETRNPAGVPALKIAVHDPHPLVVLFAARALIQITGEPTVAASPEKSLTEIIDQARMALGVMAVTSGITFSTPQSRKEKP